MSRAERIDIADEVYHVINRANGRHTLFHTDKDYQLFESILTDARDFFDMRILGYVVMPNHWHLVLHPKKDGDLARFMHWLTLTHTKRVHTQKRTVGYGHIYQGRYKSFVVEKDDYLIQLMRYVERNPVRAKLARKGEHWRWSSLWRRMHGTKEQKKLLATLPAELPRDYVSWVNEPESSERLAALRASVNKGTPFGRNAWVAKFAERYNLSATVRAVGRPKKEAY